MSKPKGLTALIILLCLVFSANGQNLVKNPSFETGGALSSPGPTPIEQADFWDHACTDAPPWDGENAPALLENGAGNGNGLPAGLLPHHGDRVATLEHNYYKEEFEWELIKFDKMRGKLWSPLQAGNYNLNVWAAGENISYPMVFVDVKISLQNSNDPCNDEFIVSDPPGLADFEEFPGDLTWYKLNFNFTIDAQDANKYDRIFFRRGSFPVFTSHQKIYIDDLVMTESVPDISSVIGSVCSKQAKVSIPEGIQEYRIKIKNLAGNVTYCTIDENDYPSPATFYPYTFCNIICGAGNFYQFEILYKDYTGAMHSEAVYTELLCSPNVAALANPSVVCPGDLVTYTAFDPATGNPEPGVTYTWYDDNGPLGTGASLGPLSYTPGNGVIGVVASNSNDCEAKAVADLAMDDDCEGVGFCFADFNWTSNETAHGKCEVAFTDASTAASNIISWIWDFGDQTGWNGQNPPVHTYPDLNGYIVCLTITTADGCTSQRCRPAGCIRSGGRQAMPGQNGEAVFTFYPNPVSSFLHISLAQNLEEKGTVNIYNMHGQLLLSGPLSQTHGVEKIDVSALPSGMYTVEIRSEQGRLAVEKIVIAH